MSRTEHDVIGTIEIDDSKYYGINTARAVDNFKISGMTHDSDHIISITRLKEASAWANMEGGKLSKEKADAIIRACEMIISGKYHDQFVIDVFQAGAGTSYNMNANEVIANVALEILGRKKGEYSVIHPNDHVNMSQSTNDAYPTMMRMTVAMKTVRYLKELDDLVSSLGELSKRYRNEVKSGRTHLQDAAPVTLGLEFSAWKYALERDRKEMENSLDFLMELNIGGTAVGTGINTSPNFRKNVVSKIRDLTGMKFRESENLPGLMEFMTDFNRVMNAIEDLAIDLTKISNDIRLMYSGPGTGFHEITIPAVQQGSSIMPGKINPSIAECMNMICNSVAGSQTSTNLSSMAGQFELNVMMPNIDYEICRSIDIMTNGMHMFRTKLIDGIKPDSLSLKAHLSRSFGSAALLNPVLGYDQVALIVQESLKTGKPIKELAIATGKITEEKYNELMASGIPG
ncbi:MAG: aspartate ammonia-lyase [Candidatus Thermoplasmatota archaeon]|nr:aspartate ammonia-lyase [Candidatus Thermoplasmatota archaeon]MCL5665392.1 aspartate ammonia-lyase [Candidatus Thermoplasmatota archaeon]